MLSTFYFALSRRIGYTAVLLMLLPGLLVAQTINVKDYGVTTVGDQTSRLNSLIAKNKGKTLYFPKGNYQVSTLSINNDIKLTGREVVIMPSSKAGIAGRLVDIRSGNVSIKGLTFNGYNKRAIGIYISNLNTTNNVTIDSCAVINVLGNKSMPGYGIQINKNTGQVRIVQVLIKNIGGVGDGIVGNLIGANRGVYINNVKNVLVQNCTFTNITGDEDGDGVHYYRWDGKTAASVRINANNFTNISKRAIKLHSGNTTVENNKMTRLSTTASSWAAISVYSSNNIIRNNKINLYRSFCGIEVGSGITGNKLSSNSIDIKQFANKYFLSPIVNYSQASTSVLGTMFNGSSISITSVK